MYTTAQKKVIAFVCNKYIESHPSIKDSDKDRLNQIIDESQSNVSEYVPLVDQGTIDEVVKLSKMTDDIISQYGSMAGDMSMIDEYDRLKKESLVLLANLADKYSVLKAHSDYADENIKVLRAVIQKRLLESGKSAAAADVMSRSDEEYMEALRNKHGNDLVTNMVKTKYSALDVVNKCLIQSASTARVNMVKEGGSDFTGRN